MVIPKISFINEDIFFQTRMTQQQFVSIGEKIRRSDIENEIYNNRFFRNKIHLSHNPDLNQIGKYLKNSWNTENVLHLNKLYLENNNNPFILQWCFPQTYYSIFTSLLSFFKSMGYPESTHTSLLKRFGDLVEEGKFPESISMYLKGTTKNRFYGNIEKPEGIGVVEFDLMNQKTIDNQICQLLNSTRDYKLKERGDEIKKREKLKRLNPTKIIEISKNLGNTTLLDFIYRKRIKSNYQDVETFTSNLIDSEIVLNELCEIVYSFNLVSECYIYKKIGSKNFQTLIQPQFKLKGDQIIKERFEKIKLINS